MGPCIFCFRDSSEVTFSEEHLIPNSLGGSLILLNLVCNECNSKFGSEFDHVILKNPEVIDALDKLELPYDKVKLIKGNYSIHGLSENIELKGRITKNGFSFPSQSLPDGSIIHPETEYEEPLLKSILRDQRLYQAGLTDDRIMEEYKTLIEAYGKASVGDKVSCPLLGVTLVKRSDTFRIKLTPKSGCDVSRLIAKIAYEFGFLIAGRDFLLNQHVVEPLRKFIRTGKNKYNFPVIRISTDRPVYTPAHFISFQIDNYVTKVTVGFFGCIAYALLASPLEKGVLRQIIERYKIPEIIGVEYQQNLETDSFGFWALLPDGSVKYIGP